MSSKATRVCLAWCFLPIDESVRSLWHRFAEELRERGIEIVLLTPQPAEQLDLPQLTIPVALHQFARVETPPPRAIIGEPSEEALGLVEYDRAWCELGDDYRADEGLAGYLLCEAYARRLLRSFRPSLALLWGSMLPQMRAVRAIFESSHVPCFVLERGLLPRTLMIEQRGNTFDSDLSRSFVAQSLLEEVHPDEQLITKAREYYRRPEVQKYPQPDVRPAGDIKKALGLGEEKIVTLFGQFDVAAGLHPATGASRMASPCYDSTAEMLEQMIRATSRAQASLLFKPHPGDNYDYEGAFDHPNVRIVRDVHPHGLFAISNVVAAMLSTIQFELLFFDKPLLLLGHSQLWGRGIAYECAEADSLHLSLAEALERRDFDARRRAAHRFITSALRHFLIATEDDVPATHGLESLADFLSRNSSFASLGIPIADAMREFRSSHTANELPVSLPQAEVKASETPMISAFNALQRALETSKSQ